MPVSEPSPGRAVRGADRGGRRDGVVVAGTAVRTVGCGGEGTPGHGSPSVPPAGNGLFPHTSVQNVPYWERPDRSLLLTTARE